MENFNLFIGIDVSKNSIDVCCLKNDIVLYSGKFENTKPGIRKFVGQLKKLKDYSCQDTLFCMENTGLYSLKTALFLLDFNIKHIWIETPIQIIYSQGMLRGKTDKIDAQRIATYAQRFYGKATTFQADPLLLKLKSLMNLRSIMLSCKHKLQVSKKEYDQVAFFVDIKLRNKLISQIFRQVEITIKKIEIAIQQTLNEDPVILKRYLQITSITGVGKMTAIEVILATANFTRINDPRKFACYSGVAPFVYDSGTIKTRARVSDQANKNVKKTLHMAAMSAIQVKGDLQTYYQRKVEEGKNKMSVLNAVRNKIIHRIFACVNQNKFYKVDLN